MVDNGKRQFPQTVVAKQADGHSEVVLKSEPRPEGVFVAKIPNGTPVVVMSEQNEYIQIQWKDVVGFGKRTNFVEDPSPILWKDAANAEIYAQVALAPVVGAKEGAAHNLQSQLMAKQADGHSNVVLRSEPRPESAVVAKIPNGTVVAVMSEHNEYLQVQRKDVVGFGKRTNFVEYPSPIPPAIDVCKVDLFDRASLLAWIEWADVRLIDTQWLVNANEQILVNRRQELPEEAFIKLDDLEKKPIVVLSYGWSDPANPDPECQYGKLLKTYFSQRYYAYSEYKATHNMMSGGAKYKHGAALFWDHKSLFQPKLQLGWNGSKDTFKQHLLAPRTASEDKFFQRAINGMQWLYFHTETDGLIIEQVPTSGRNIVGYEKRGWTLMESAGLNLSGHVTVLNSLLGPEGNSSKGIAISQLGVPMHPDDFAAIILLRKFTHSGDCAVVSRMYKTGFEEIAPKSRSLHLEFWGEQKEVDLLAKALPHFEKLGSFYLHGYPGRYRNPDLDKTLDFMANRGCEIKAGWIGVQEWSVARTRK